ncbi:hypothetical protein L1987_02961 [Smallanthus sonchifolius]|uniref:Uncharacterized protein n=1 Tax=Smallanthus sonchifolius TaxID=185202 RepID=A0ACB9K9E3_9ASTR|nr:hypothetical protein L1987_02961 [Smallanthus sonchifolius]
MTRKVVRPSANRFLFPPWFILNHPIPPVPHPTPPHTVSLPFINLTAFFRISSNHRLLPTSAVCIKHRVNKSTMESTTTRRPYFLEENNGLASISDIEIGVSSSPLSSTEDNHRAGSHLIYSPRKASLGSLSSFSSSRSGRLAHARFEEQPHFLDACFLCKKQLGHNRDIFMYRGDTPFCSEECRAEQIDIDEAKEKTRHLSSSMRALRKKEQSETSSPKKNSKKYPFYSGAVAAA